MKDRNVLNQLLSEILQYSLKTFGSRLDSVILYGSYARNEADAESDVDVMILVNEDAQELSSHRYALNSFGTGLDLKYGVLTSMVLQDAETFYKWKDVLPFYQNVLKEGVKVVA
jgi:Nucleotidyltransferase domain.